ncbi:hypothetical protein IWQ62_000799 [Dispira parvispora]|uniref:CUE domain-containing protein n=1 Tax=Dispira parvispora TaxID=1520584 RepID=A0A9W8AV51_9FUNG|nr:hypothetical protein IWQ62_000799 [Dispira parvispora]
MSTTTEQNLQILKRMFPNIDAEVCESVLHANSGNLSTSITALLEMSGPEDSEHGSPSAGAGDNGATTAHSATKSSPAHGTHTATGNPDGSPRDTTISPQPSNSNESPSHSTTADSPNATTVQPTDTARETSQDEADTSRDEQIARDLQMALDLEEEERRSLAQSQPYSQGQTNEPPTLPQRPLYGPNGEYVNYDHLQQYGPPGQRPSTDDTQEFMNKVSNFTEQTRVKLSGFFNQMSAKINQALKSDDIDQSGSSATPLYHNHDRPGRPNRIIQDEEDDIQAYGGAPPPLPRRSTSARSEGPPIPPRSSLSQRASEESDRLTSAPHQAPSRSPVLIIPTSNAHHAGNSSQSSPLASATDRWVEDQAHTSGTQSAQQLRSNDFIETQATEVAAASTAAAHTQSNPTSGAGSDGVKSPATLLESSFVQSSNSSPSVGRGQEVSSSTPATATQTNTTSPPPADLLDVDNSWNVVDKHHP